MRDDSPYELDDPKSEHYHERMADLWDGREKCSTEAGVSNSLELVAALEGTGALTPTGLVLEGEISRERFEALGAMLGQGHSMFQWAIGDWLIESEKRYGHEAFQIAEVLGISPESKAQYLRVAEAIELPRRLPLSWSHHRAVAALSPLEQDRFLGEAVRGGWGKRELEAHVKAELGPRPQRQPVEEGVIVVEHVLDAAKDVYVHAERKGKAYVVPSERMDSLGSALGMRRQ